MMANYGVDVYGNAIIVNPKFATDHPDAVKGLSARLREIAQEHREGSGGRGRFGRQTRRGARFDKAIDQIAFAYAFNARPRSDDIFDSSSLPAAGDRVMD
jgi:NitT/TauT family transport system substrate-binding protein